MAILIIMPNRDCSAVRDHLIDLDPRLDIRVWPETGNPDEIRCALTWQHPAGSLKEFSNLSLIHSFGAGVDHLLSDPELPSDIPICRVVDPGLAKQMNEYLLCAVLNHRFALQDYWQLQQTHSWHSVDRATGDRVGILGLGQLGESAAKYFNANGFEVHGWSRSHKTIDNVTSHTGENGLHHMAALVDYLICLLPLTSQTEGILNRRLFQVMRPNSYLINVGRGPHLIEDDLIEALNNGQLAGACLDVTATEPLPKTHPLWEAKNITITPHISSLSDPRVVAEQVLDNYRRRLSGTPLKNLVDREKGY